MRQGRAISAIEAATNVIVGWVVALLAQLLVFPVIGLQVTVAQNLGLSAVFASISLARSYILRRLFERAGCTGGSGDAQRTD